MRAIEEQAVNSYISAAQSPHATHIAVFEYGTVVALSNIPPPTQALPFTREYINEWPVERLSDPADLAEYIAESAEIYANCVAVWGSAIAYAAYTSLIQSGYLAADERATRAANPVADGVWQVVYAAQGDIENIVSLSASVSPECAETAAVLGGEYRRFDWMFPNLRYVFASERVCDV